MATLSNRRTPVKTRGFLKLHEGVELRFINDDKVSWFDFLTVEGILENEGWKFYPWSEEDLATAKELELPYTESFEEAIARQERM
jgi:hypothetical protein